MSLHVLLRLPVSLFVLAGFVSAPMGAAPPRQLTFEERLAAQEAIERVYHSYREGASLPFEAAVTSEVLSGKVRRTLLQSAALERYWNTPVTGEALRRELERMARDSQLPGRLQRVFDALGNDSFLIQETLVRASLVDRLSRRFFAFDGAIHAPARAEAEDARSWLRRGGPGRESDPRWNVTEVVRAAVGARQPGRLELDAARFAEWRARAPRRVGEVGPVREERGAFLVQVLLSEGSDRFRLGTYAVPKRSWGSWWEEARAVLDPRGVRPVASAGEALTVPGGEGSCVGDLWDNGILDDIPEPRFDHTAVWTGTEMIIWGGIGTAPHLDTGGRYDPLTDSWAPTSQINSPASRRSHVAVWTGTEMIVWGGNQISTFLDDGARYDPVADTWTPVTMTNAPTGRQGHTGVWTGSEMIVWGGNAGGGSFNTGGRYDPLTDTWVDLPTAFAPLGRTGHVAVWTGSLMVIWGGKDSAAVATGGRYDPATDTWSSMNLAGAPQERSGHSAVWTGSEMIIWGGVDFTMLLRTGGRYDPVADSWILPTTLGAPTARRDHSAVWTGTEMIIWGGAAGANLLSGARYDPMADSWTATDEVEAPAPRGLHTAVWTGDLMVVWGGAQQGELNTTGGRYDPDTDGWTPTADASGQVGRKDHTAVWTGNRMIIFGGFSTPGPVYLSSGGIYDPVTDAWSGLSDVNVPEGRELHAAVWSGDHMIVWGGFNGFDYLNSGGRYDPLIDTWTPTATTGAPTIRQGPSAVWTGSEMIIWGGFEEDIYLNDGRRYDPDTDTWTPTTVAGAPQARFLHSAIWTGSEMIIWGGSEESGARSDGGRYDPGADTWAPLSVVNAPSGRNRNTAIWTGEQMVVFGGFDAIDYLSDGGRYNPATDTWQSISSIDAPDGRIDHTAVWTGEFMVIWGGFDGSQFPYLGTGAQYDPVADNWGPISLSNAPSPRNDHTAVWIGDRMIIWGGSDGSVLNTGGRYLLTQVPGETDDLGFSNATDLTWAVVSGDGVLYDVLRGNGSDLPVGSGVSESCIASGIAANLTSDAAVPAAGQAFWYLSRAKNVCETGIYGHDSSGSERISGTCP